MSSDGRLAVLETRKGDSTFTTKILERLVGYRYAGAIDRPIAEDGIAPLRARGRIALEHEPTLGTALEGIGAITERDGDVPRARPAFVGLHVEPIDEAGGGGAGGKRRQDDECTDHDHVACGIMIE